MQDRRLTFRFGKKDRDVLDLLATAAAKTGMDTAKLVKLSLRAVLPCLIEGCDPSDVCAIDGKTARATCTLRGAADRAGENLIALLDQLRDELDRTPPGTLHGPVQFRPTDEAERDRRVRERMLDVAASIQRIADSLA